MYLILQKKQKNILQNTLVFITLNNRDDYVLHYILLYLK